MNVKPASGQTLAVKNARARHSNPTQRRRRYPILFDGVNERFADPKTLGDRVRKCMWPSNLPLFNTNANPLRK